MHFLDGEYPHDVVKLLMPLTKFKTKGERKSIEAFPSDITEALLFKYTASQGPDILQFIAMLLLF